MAHAVTQFELTDKDFNSGGICSPYRLHQIWFMKHVQTFLVLRIK